MGCSRSRQGSAALSHCPSRAIAHSGRRTLVAISSSCSSRRRRRWPRRVDVGGSRRSPTTPRRTRRTTSRSRRRRQLLHGHDTGRAPSTAGRRLHRRSTDVARPAPTPARSSRSEPTLRRPATTCSTSTPHVRSSMLGRDGDDDLIGGDGVDVADRGQRRRHAQRPRRRSEGHVLPAATATDAVDLRSGRRSCQRDCDATATVRPRRRSPVVRRRGRRSDGDRPSRSTSTTPDVPASSAMLDVPLTSPMPACESPTRPPSCCRTATYTFTVHGSSDASGDPGRSGRLGRSQSTPTAPQVTRDAGLSRDQTSTAHFQSRSSGRRPL